MIVHLVQPRRAPCLRRLAVSLRRLCAPQRGSSSIRPVCLHPHHRAEFPHHLHVDDELVASNDLPTLEGFKAEFARQYAIKDNGPARMFLGIKVIRDREKRTLALSLQRFISDLLKDFGWDQLSPNKTPAPRITDSEIPSDKDHQNSLWFNYRRFVGSVQYLASNGRPDIIPAVSDLGRDLNKHGAAQIAKCKHLAKYYECSS